MTPSVATRSSVAVGIVDSEKNTLSQSMITTGVVTEMEAARSGFLLQYRLQLAMIVPSIVQFVLKLACRLGAEVFGKFVF